jgi:hypothetical protein
MAVIGVRNSVIQSVIVGSRTELRWLVNDGTTTKESSDQVANLNKSTSVLGHALDSAGDRTTARNQPYAANTLVDEAAPV